MHLRPLSCTAQSNSNRRSIILSGVGLIDSPLRPFYNTVLRLPKMPPPPFPLQPSTPAERWTFWRRSADYRSTNIHLRILYFLCKFQPSSQYGIADIRINRRQGWSWARGYRDFLRHSTTLFFFYFLSTGKIAVSGWDDALPAERPWNTEAAKHKNDQYTFSAVTISEFWDEKFAAGVAGELVIACSGFYVLANGAGTSDSGYFMDGV